MPKKPKGGESPPSFLSDPGKVLLFNTTRDLLCARLASGDTSRSEVDMVERSLSLAKSLLDRIEGNDWRGKSGALLSCFHSKGIDPPPWSVIGKWIKLAGGEAADVVSLLDGLPEEKMMPPYQYIWGCLTSKDKDKNLPPEEVRRLS